MPHCGSLSLTNSSCDIAEHWRRRTSTPRKSPLRRHQSTCPTTDRVSAALCGFFLLGMRMRGLEPPRPERHTDLNRARLPIPPHPRAGDSSRPHGYWHAARQPPPPIGVTPTMNRVLGLLIALSVGCLVAGCGSDERAGMSGPMSEVVVTFDGPAIAGATGAAERVARARIDSEQSRFASALEETIPAARIHWRYRARPERSRRRRPEPVRRPAADAPGRRQRRRQHRLQRRLRHGSGRRTSCEDLADRPHERRRRHQDRDHRRRRRPDAPVLLTRRLHDASRVPEGADGVHHGQGDRRARVRARKHDLEERAQALRPAPVGARHARRRHRGRATPTRPQPAASRSPASRRRRTSATTRRLPCQPTRTSGSTAIPPRSSPRSRPPSRTG